MCRNIRTLHNFEPATTDAEVRDAALQYVRKGTIRATFYRRFRSVWAVSAVDDWQRWIEVQEIGAVGADHRRLVAPGDYHDGCVHHIAGIRGAAQYPGGSRRGVRERLDGHLVGVEQPRHSHLPRSLTPGLSDDSSRNDDSAAILAANLNQRSSCPISPFHGDKRAGI